MTKRCHTCGVEKDIAQFYKNRVKKDGRSGRCRECTRKWWNSLYKHRYAPKAKILRAERSRIRKETWMKDRRYCKRCDCNRLLIHFDPDNKFKHCLRCERKIVRYKRRYRSIMILKQRQYHQSHKEVCNERSREYSKRNRESLREKHREYVSGNLNYRIALRLRVRLNKALKARQSKKSSRAIELLGCSIENFKIYIESKFEPGMSWENWGVAGWHIDHIIPCSIFDLARLEHQKICFHFSNMQPLWAKENLSKRDKLIMKEV